MIKVDSSYIGTSYNIPSNHLMIIRGLHALYFAKQLLYLTL